MTERLLALVRHGQSEWNSAGLFAGRTDIDLTDVGVTEAREAGRRLKAGGFGFDVGFTTTLKRAHRTLDFMLAELGQTGIPVVTDARLDERDYGEMTGVTRADAITRWGEEQCISGGAPTARRRPAAKACATPRRACCPVTCRTSCRGCCVASACWWRRTAIRCARC